jgi:CheY-like chemotaxis protein
MKSLAIRAHAKGLELALDIDPKVPDVVVGDDGRLRQVIVNLVGNAIKFTERGEVVVRVECESVKRREAVIRFSIRDTGIGIPREKLEKVFNAFEQADTSAARRCGGTGLGLAICSRLVEMMGGQIWAESDASHGATFHFTVKTGISHASPDRSQRAKTKLLRGTRVMVVDDNDTNRQILREMLSSWGMKTTLAPSADEAMRQMRAAVEAGEPFRLLLTDVNRPDADGFASAGQLVGDDGSETTVIAMFTSGDRPSDIDRSKRLGAAAYLIKPIKQSELYDAIVAALGIAMHDDEAQNADVDDELCPLPPLRILLAEDSLTNQKLAIGLLAKWGHSVTVAGTGREAIELLNSGEVFDLVLMDVQMPEMDGFETTTAIRSRDIQTGTHTPIIAMTAHAMKGDRKKCLAAGMDGYVAKPIRTKTLYRAIARLFPAGEFANSPDNVCFSRANSETLNP